MGCRRDPAAVALVHPDLLLYRLGRDGDLPPPDPGFQYIEYGPDLLLVNVATGEIVQVFPGAFS